MHVAKIERRRGGKTYVSYLLRRTYRSEGKVKHETLANLSRLPEPVIEQVRRALLGETFVPASQAFRTLSSKPHGAVDALLTACKRLEIEDLLGSSASRERSIILGLLVQRLLSPCSKLACTRLWHQSTLAEELGLVEVNRRDVYAALDWLLDRQPYIERKLARRHLQEDGIVLYDISSSYYYGKHCPLARYGYSRDKKQGLPIVVFGLLTDQEGRPVALQVYPGNTADSTTVVDQVGKLRHRFGLNRVILVGDRGMLTHTQIDLLRQHPGLGWVSALASRDILDLIESHKGQLATLEQKRIAEIESADYPGERLVVCYNADLAARRRQTREELLQATEVELASIQKDVARRTKKPLEAAEIGVRVGKVIGQHKMAKHFRISIGKSKLEWSRDAEKIAREEQLDGIYIIRTGEKVETLPTDECVRTYKRLTQVEAAFRCMKSDDIAIRPIYHRLPERVRAHMLLCTLAYYVEMWLRRTWASLLYQDEEKDLANRTRNPVEPAESSESAKEKKKKHKTRQDYPAHSFRTLLSHLATRCRSTHEMATDTGGIAFQQLTEMDPLQKEAHRLLTL